jgi:endonuclease YncB( thermonuclease family)
VLSVRRRVAASALLALCGLSLAHAAKPVPEWAGRVTHVSDGDSLWVQPEDTALKPVEIRLADIDAPEICQPWGGQAREALKERVGGKTVGVRVVGRDGYGRTLARVLLEGQSVNAWLVSEGHAYSHRTRWDQGPLVKQEKVARTLRRGVHAHGGAMLPKDFRRSHGPCERAGGVASGAGR